MKKTVISFLSFLLFAPGVLAATIVSEYSTVIDKNEVQKLAPLIITSTSDGDIKAEHGIRILINPFDQVFFDNDGLSITGAAISNGKVNLNVKPSYASDYRSLFIPVMENFEAADWLSVQGLALRSDHDGFAERKLGLDLDGDFIAEIEDIRSYSLGNEELSKIDSLKKLLIRLTIFLIGQ